MRERLRIGEIAGLVGVTPKTVRHYEKVGLLKEAERSESGYRLYAADDLLRLHRVKRLRSLGLSLKQVRSVLGGEDGGIPFRDTLAALRADVDSQIGRLQERRRLLEEMLSREVLEAPEASPTFDKAMDLLGEHLSGVDEKALEQEKKVWATLDAFEWPDGYDEGNEKLFRYYAEHPEEYGDLLAVGERLAALSEAPEDAPGVEEAAEGLWAHFEKYPTPEYLKSSPWAEEGPIGQTMMEVMVSNMSPAQKRVMALIVEWAERKEQPGA